MTLPRRPRRRIWITGGIFLVLALVLFIGPWLVPTGFIRRELSGLVRRETGLRLRIAGPVRLSVFPVLGLTLNQATLGNPSGFKGPPLLTVGRAAIGVGLTALLTGHIRVRTLTLSHVALALITDRKGATNYATLTRMIGPSQPAPSNTRSPAQVPPLPFEALGRIRFRQVGISEVNRQTGTVEQLHLLEVVAGPIHAGRRFPLRVKARFTSHRPQPLAATLNLKTRVLYQPTDGLSLKRTVFTLALSKPRSLTIRGLAPSLEISLSKDFILLKKINLQGNGFHGFLSARGRLWPTPLRAFGGSARLTLDRIRPWFGGALDHLIRTGRSRPPLTLATHWRLTGTRLSLSQLAMALGSEKFTGFIRVGTIGNRRHFSFLLAGNSLTLGAFPASKAGSGHVQPAARGPGAAMGSRSHPAAQNWNWLRQYAGGGHLRIGTLEADGLAITNLQVDFRMSRGILTAQPLSAQMLGGGLVGAGSLSAGPDNSPRIAFNLNVHGISARQLVRRLGSHTLSPLAGRFDARLTTRFAGQSRTAIARTLTGSGQLSMQAARWEGLDLDRIVRAVRKALGGHIPATWPQGGVTPLGRMNLSFRLAGPLLQVMSLALETPGLMVTGRGQFNWLDPNLSLRLLLAPRPNPTGRREWPTALAGIPIPVTVSGPPSTPRISLSIATLLKAEARAKAQSLLGRLLGHLIHHG